MVIHTCNPHTQEPEGSELKPKLHRDNLSQKAKAWGWSLVEEHLPAVGNTFHPHYRREGRGGEGTGGEREIREKAGRDPGWKTLRVCSTQ